jgi:hypothetical protein
MSFLQDYQKLKQQSPMILNHGLKNENAEYTDYIYRSKDAYFAFDGGNVYDSGYVFNCTKVTDTFDCDHLWDSELCYECTDGYKNYGSSYLEYCTGCTNCHFCFNVRHSRDCFGCVGLQHQAHCIFNVQYSKKEYQEKVKELLKRPAEEHLRRLGQLKKKFPFQASHQLKTENCPYGDYVYRSANCYWCFDLESCQNCLYTFDSPYCQDCVDSFRLYKCELCWECVGLGHAYDSSFCVDSDYLRNCHFCNHCYKSEHLFGCVNLIHAKYCILNKQYSKEEYFQKVNEIKKELGWPN